MSPFDRECKAVAAQLQQINPTGINPTVKRGGACRDCGRYTTEDYLCRPCAADLRRERAERGETVTRS